MKSEENVNIMIISLRNLLMIIQKFKKILIKNVKKGMKNNGKNIKKVKKN